MDAHFRKDFRVTLGRICNSYLYYHFVKVELAKDHLPSKRSLTSLSAFKPSSFKFLSICLLFSDAILYSWLTVHPIMPIVYTSFRQCWENFKRSLYLIYLTNIFQGRAQYELIFCLQGFTFNYAMIFLSQVLA